MAKKAPATAAIRALRAAHVDFEIHTYRYEPRGGTRVSARELGVPEHAVIKTLIFQTDAGDLLVVLMHGDREVSTGALARAVGARDTRPCEPRQAERATGYQFGGTSPFGLRQPLPVLIERSILDLDRLFINGGKRGLLVAMAPAELQRAIQTEPVEVARPVG